MRRSKFQILFLLVWLNAPSVALAADTPAAHPKSEDFDFFEKKIRPVLVDQCYKCHSAQSEKLKGALRVDTREGLLKGGKTGPAAVPGDLEKSLLIRAIRYTDDEMLMPPKSRLPVDVVKDFEAWVKMGLPDPRNQTTPVLPPEPAYNYVEARKFWSFQPPKEPRVPDVKNTQWPATPIDRFILAKQEEKSITPVQDADKRALLRRATFDLTGLPPSPDEMETFLKDESPAAFEKVIDRLLASPQYGEQWGRHWLDVIRFADTSGCNSDFPIPPMYRFRNYVIDSFNQDKPFDQFVREQIAGDLMPAVTNAEHYQKTVATGYLAISRRFGSGAEAFHLTIEDTIDTTGKAMLGLSLGCARCHDHKFDPVPNNDYYALYGIFKSTRYAFPGTENFPHAKDFVPLAPFEEAEAFRKSESESGALDTKIRKLIDEKQDLERQEKLAKEAEAKLLAVPDEKPEKTAAAKDAKDAKDTKESISKEAQAEAEKDKAAEAPKEPKKPQKEIGTMEEPDTRKQTLFRVQMAMVKADLEDARNRQKTLDAKFATTERAYAVSEGTPGDAKLHRKGDPTILGEEVPRGFLTILGGPQLPKGFSGSGRLQLAQWMTDANNPLTARVMANRIWQQHFGHGIVQTPNDFGVRGRRPTHPELLDYLALRFVEGGWSIKALHKQIMLSHVYRLASVQNAKDAEADADNELLWRFNRRRLSAEEFRDAMLDVSGALDRTMAGPHPFPPASQWHYTQHTPFIATYETRHRSIYLMQQRIRKQPFLELFDGADTNATTGERPVSTTAIQALYFMNDPFMHEQADTLAVRVGMAYADDTERIKYVYDLAFGRPPTAGEIDTAIEYLRKCKAAMKETDLPKDKQSRAALASYMRMLMSSNEFMFVE